MATADALPDDAARGVAAQLAAFLPTARGPAGLDAAPAAPAELTESLAVCSVGADQVRKPPADLAALVAPSGVWHHQIRRGGLATHTARSVQPGFDPAALDVQSVFESPIAGRIDDAMAWVDKNVKGRATVRLLVAPAYYVHALVVVRDGKELTAVLADQPAGFKRLEYNRVYTLREFLALLAKEKPSGTLG